MRANVLVTRDEWRRIPDGTELAALVPLLREGVDEVLVIEDEDGQICACWALIPALHAEGVWSREDMRGRPQVLFKMMALLKDRVTTKGFRRVFTSATSDDVRQLITRIGGEAYPESYTLGVE